jgi:uncharacterized protein (TIGR00661 family)
MKILYAIQGTGNGHITVAREVLPYLLQHGEVDILISAHQVDVGLPYPVRYRLNGLGFVFGKNGGIDYLETYRKGKIKKLFREIRELPVEDYDLVISDFEPVSAWACYLKGKPCIGFSHQAAVVCKGSPKPSATDLLGKAVLKYYAPVSRKLGFHYLPYDRNIYTPIIRREVRQLTLSNAGHYTVYLPAYSDKRILRMLACFPQVRWQVFSKHCTESFSEGQITVQPIAHDAFLQSLASSAGVLCGAGFQTPAEVIFLRKKLMVIPMKGQYEQQCNAAALKLLGVPVLKNLKMKQQERIGEWLQSDTLVQLDFPDETEYIIQELVERSGEAAPVHPAPGKKIDTASRFRQLLLKKIFYQLKG